jgi:hypothetical protein
VVACLEKNPDVTTLTRGTTTSTMDFRAKCTNIATWCGVQLRGRPIHDDL